MASTETQALHQAIQQLTEKRAEYQNAIAEIDAALLQYGIEPDLVGGKPHKPAVKRAAKKAPAAPAKRPGRKPRVQSDENAEQFVLRIVKELGTPTTAEVNEAWAAAGRGGQSNNAITKLVSDGKIKRLPHEGRGSKYALA